MRTIVHTVCLLLMCCLPAVAENYPYRSDVLWVTVPDHPNWIYSTGQQATINLQLLRYGMPVDGVTMRYELADDLMPADQRDSVVVKQGRATIAVGTLRKPGFRDCRMSVVLDGKEYKHHIKVGFSPEKIEPYTQMPADFEHYWQQSIHEDRQYPLNYTLQPAPAYSTDKIDAYLLRLQLNRQGQAIYGYLFYPKQAQKGSCPVVLCPPGAGIKTISKPLRHKYYAEGGCIRLEIEIHGLNPTMSDEQFKEIATAFNGKENGYLTNGLDHRDNFYMKRVYLALVRCIDLLTSLPEWDGKNVVVTGGSQGGALAMVAAGLDPRITLCVANHPALADMAGFKIGRADGYPHYSRIQGMDTPEKLRTMAYYDVVNFARLIKATCRLTWGFCDDTCSPTTSYATYNVLTCPKEALITPINEHWTSDETEQDHWQWVKSKLKADR